MTTRVILRFVKTVEIFEMYVFIWPLEVFFFLSLKAVKYSHFISFLMAL